MSPDFISTQLFIGAQNAYMKQGMEIGIYFKVFPSEFFI